LKIFLGTYLWRHVGQQKRLVAEFLILFVISGGGEMSSVEAAALFRK
jgi:hypothetical protein